MFQFFQTHLKSIYLILTVFIILSFGFFFNVETGQKSNIVGHLFGSPVKDIDFYRAQKAVFIEARLRYGRAFSFYQQFMDFEQEAWNRLMLLEKADKKNIKVSSNDLQEDLLRLFQPEEKDKSFDWNKYQDFIVRNLQMNISEFEEMRRNSLKIQKLQDTIHKDVSISDEEVKNYYNEENNKLELSFVKVESSSFEKDVPVDTESLQTFFNNAKHKFEIPEKIALDYLEIKKSDFKSKIEASEQELKDYYEENKEQYKLEKEEELSIDAPDVALPENPDLDEEKYKSFESVRENVRAAVLTAKIEVKTEQEADSIYRKMIEMESFDEVVKSLNLNVKTSSLFSKNNPPLEVGSPGSGQIKDAFELTVNDYNGPYSTRDGFIIVKVKEKKESFIPDQLELVRDQVEKSYRIENAPPLAKTKAEEYRQKILGMGSNKTFEEKVRDLGLKNNVSGLVSIKSQTIKGIGGAADIIPKIFELKEDEISELFELDAKKGYIFGQISKREKPDSEKLKEKWETIKKTALGQKQKEVFSEWFSVVRKEASLQVRMPAQASRI